jgi:hypothetical protein
VATDAANNAHYYDSPNFRQRGEVVTCTIRNEGWKSVAVIVGSGHSSGRYDVTLSCVEPVSAGRLIIPPPPRGLYLL